MSISSGFVHCVAESLGLKATDDAAKTLAPDVEFRLREVIQVWLLKDLFFCWAMKSLQPYRENKRERERERERETRGWTLGDNENSKEYFE